MSLFKVDLSSISSEDFLVTRHVIGGQDCYFVRPKPTFFDWTEKVLHFRSSIYKFNGELISASYPKFFNLSEKPNIHPFDGNLQGTSLMEKLDGSTLIVSRFRGETILRTRGTVDAAQMPNADELEVFKEQILPKLPQISTWNASYIFEWTSPKNRIILDYGPEPQFFLTNIVNHYDYGLASQDTLDLFANDLGILRPKRFKYYSLSHLTKDVDQMEGQEGICLYYDEDQHIRKIKSANYLKLHAFKSQCNLKTVLQLYTDWGFPEESEFRYKILQNFDYESMLFADSIITELFERGAILAAGAIQKVTDFVSANSSLDQKTFAQVAKETLSPSDYSLPLAFTLRKRADADISEIRQKMIAHFLGI